MTSRTPLSRLVKAYLSSSQEAPASQWEADLLGPFAQSHPALPAGECLLWDEMEWMQECHSRSYQQCNRFLTLVSTQISPLSSGNATTSWELLQSVSMVSSGLPQLDEVLVGGGGFRAGQLVEFVSMSGLGKSIWALTCLARQVVLGNKTVLYVDTDGKFKHDRWREIVLGVGGTELQASQLHLLRVSELELAHTQICSMAERLYGAGLSCIVLDSITGLAGKAGGGPEMYSKLFKLASELKTMAEQYHVPVLVTNQQKPEVEAAYLGNSWHHVVNVRLFLLRDDADGSRYCKVAKSPDCAEQRVGYCISTCGILPTLSSSAQQQQQEWMDLFGSMTQEELNAVL
ncbi:hypothetical protein BASA81_008273 [Batrachochytrium salamandrivorans]|nr:hypothetical protein BASA81_008273 [Batrachochytrium salamandrivorans]